MEVFGVDIDLKKNQLRNAVLGKLFSFPTLTAQDEGYIFSHTVNKKPYYWNGTTWIDLTSGVASLNSITDYRSSFEVSDGKIYAGYLINTVPMITRTLDSVVETAILVTDLELDWTNRLSLTYI